MKKRLLIFLLCISIIFISARPSKALVPILLGLGLPNVALWGSALFHTAAVGAIAYFTMTPSGKAVYDSVTGKIAKPAQLSWVEIDLNSIPSTFVTKTSVIQASLDDSKIRSILGEHSNETVKKYPQLTIAYDDRQGPPAPDPSTPIGAVVSMPGGDTLVTGKTVQGGQFSLLPVWLPSYRIYDAPNSTTQQVKILSDIVNNAGGEPIYARFLTQIWGTLLPPPIPIQNATIAKVKSRLASIDGQIDTLFESELDAMIAEEANENWSMNMVSDSPSAVVGAGVSPPPVVIPSTALTQKQIDSKIAADALVATAAAGVSSAASAAAAANAAAAIANAAAASSPGDASLAAAAAAANTAANAANAALAGANNSNAGVGVSAAGAEAEAVAEQDIKSQTANLPNANVYDGTVESPEEKSILSLLTGFLSGSPLVAMVQSFQVSTSEADCSVFVGEVYGIDMVIDLCRWDSHLRAVGGMFLIIMQGYAVLVVIRGW